MRKRIIVLFSQCECDVTECQCPDPPTKEEAGFTFNRMGEEFMRFLRFWRLIN